LLLLHWLFSLLLFLFLFLFLPRTLAVATNQLVSFHGFVICVLETAIEFALENLLGMRWGCRR
jgi:hypothetical protein